MKESLRVRGVAVLDALIKTGNMQSVIDAKAWEHDVCRAFPVLNILGPYSNSERLFVEEHVSLRVSDFRLMAGSTLDLTDGDIKTVIETVAVRLHRIQYDNLSAKSGPKPKNNGNAEEEFRQLMASPNPPPSKLAAARQAVANCGRGSHASDTAAVDALRKLV